MVQSWLKTIVLKVEHASELAKVFWEHRDQGAAPQVSHSVVW
jgi:hypothetical protein